MAVQSKSWAYGTTRTGRVLRTRHDQKPMTDAQLVVDDHRNGHVLIGDAADWTAKQGDTGKLTFMAGGPTGGYWKFVKDKVPIPCSPKLNCLPSITRCDWMTA